MNKKETQTIFVTGAAGFIGAAFCQKLLQNGVKVIAIDNLNKYYDPKFKKLRLKNIERSLYFEKSLWHFYEGSLEDYDLLEEIFNKNNPKIVVNLAAQAGVRYSLENPFSYVQSNLVGFTNILEICRKFSVSNLIYASSSSVYGGNKSLPYNELQNVDHPISFYAATKKANELMAHSYSSLYNIPSTALRFFTVYGPWGRPDMAPMLFAKSILKGEEISVYNSGQMMRDFTYIDDIIEVIWRCCNKPATPDIEFNKLDPNPSTSFAPHRIFNVGNGVSINLIDFIETLESELDIKAKKVFIKLQKGDVIATHADTTKIKEWINFSPKINLKNGIHLFTKWFLGFYEDNY